MARVIKSLQELTLLYVLEQRGSRWKNKMEADDRTAYLDNLKIFLSNVPEMRNVPAYLMLGTPDEMFPIPTLDGMYAFYGNVIDVIDSVSIAPMNEEVDNTNVDVEWPESVDIVNIDYSVLQSAITRLVDSVNETVGDLASLDDNIAAKRKQLATIRLELSSKEEKLSATSESGTVPLNGEADKIIAACTKYGYKVLDITYHDDRFELTTRFIATPRLMHDTDGHYDAAMTMPIVMRMELDVVNHYISLYPDGTTYPVVDRGVVRMRASYPHPHLSHRGICWGDIDIERASADNDVDTLLGQFDALLTSYNDGSPYMTMPTYTRRYNINAMRRRSDIQEERLATYLRKLHDKYEHKTLTVMEVFGYELGTVLTEKYPTICSVFDSKYDITAEPIEEPPTVEEEITTQSIHDATTGVTYDFPF